MKPAYETGRGLVQRLPALRGRLEAELPLAPKTWFRVGGPAELVFRPADVEDLALLVAERPEDVPVHMLGVASNTLVRDGGVRGVTIRLGRGFTGVRVEGDTVTAGAGALDGSVALAAAESGIGGLEFLSGIPGTIGGALRMNAGAYGSDVSRVLVSATAMDERGAVHELSADALGLGYRHCGLAEGWIFLAAKLRGTPASSAEISERMAMIRASREATQPVRARTGGSTFANPPGAKAWQLIDEAGCRGLKRGGAMVSELHANFLLNVGGAIAADLEGLGEEVRRRVFERSGLTLQWEIRRIGRPLTGLEEVAG